MYYLRVRVRVNPNHGCGSQGEDWITNSYTFEEYTRLCVSTMFSLPYSSSGTMFRLACIRRHLLYCNTR